MSKSANAAKRAAAVLLLQELIDELECQGRRRTFSGKLSVETTWENGLIVDVKAVPIEHVGEPSPPDGPRSILEFRHAG